MIERLRLACSKVPLTRKSLLLGLLLGVVLWAALDILQSTHLHRLLHRELDGTLALQAAVHQQRFNEEVHRTEGVLRLLARHAWVVEHAGRLHDEPAAPTRLDNGAWLPPQDAWEGLVMPAAFVLSDPRGRVREAVDLGALDRSVLLRGELGTLVAQARSGGRVIDVDDVPVLVASQPVVDARGEPLAVLTMLAAIDERFLGLVLADSIGQGVLVLARAGDGAVVASSHPCTVGTDETLQGLGHAYLQSGVPLDAAVVGNSAMRLVTLVDHDRLAILDGAVSGLSRQQRFIAAMAFIGLFTLIILASARRIERLRERVEKFIETELRGSPAGSRGGDQILDLEDRFAELTQAVLKGRDAMHRNYRLQAHVDQLEVLYAVTERLGVGVVSIKDGHAVPVNATMQRFVDECGGIARFGNLEGGIGRLEMDCRSPHQRVFDLKSLETGKGERVVLVRDVTELEKQRAALEFQSLHDGLTSLPNRVLLNDRLEQSLSAAARNQGVVTLVLIDINRFKDVNETLGHQAGDEVLRRVVDRFHAVIRSDDTLARIGGDEFAIILRDCDTRQAFHVCDKLAGALHEPLLIADHKVAMDISIGLAGFPRDARDAETLMRRADAALAHAKATQQPLCSFDARLDASSKDRLLLMAELRDALRHGDNGLMLHYQPQVRIQDGRIMAVEALLRWDHAARGMVPPGAFIPMVEQSPLINHLTRWVIDAALSDLVHWRKLQPDLRVAVNLSTRNLADPGLVPYVVDRLGRYGVPAQALVLEITESAIMWDPARARAILQTLQSMGIGISVDDFGTGHSSLAYLSRLPVSELKIDRTFVQGMLRRNIDRTIVHATVDLGHNLGLEVVAEGVETPEEFEALKAIGCDLVQGYLLGRPMRAADVEELLAEGRLPMPDPPASQSGGPKLIYQRERP